MNNVVRLPKKALEQLPIDRRLAIKSKDSGSLSMGSNLKKLLKQIEKGGASGRFLADIFLSGCRLDVKFNHSFAELRGFDKEVHNSFSFISNMHLFHECGWDGMVFYEIEQKILSIKKNKGWD